MNKSPSFVQSMTPQLNILCRKSTAITICLSAILGGIISAGFKELERAQSPIWEKYSYSYWKQMERAVCVNIFFGNVSDHTACQNSSWMGTALSILAVPVTLGRYYNYLNTFIVALLLLMSSLSLWSSSKTFSGFLFGSTSANKGSELYEMLQSFKELSKLVSNAVGGLVTAKIVQLVIDYGGRFDSLIF